MPTKNDHDDDLEEELRGMIALHGSAGDAEHSEKAVMLPVCLISGR